MIVDRIKFTKEFNYHGISEWIGVEGSISPTDDLKESVLSLRKQIVEIFNTAVENPDAVKYVTSEKIDYAGDAEFELLKDNLAGIEFKEDAEEYLLTTPFKHAAEAKILIINKPSKNKQNE